MSAIIKAAGGFATPRPDLTDAFIEWRKEGVSYVKDDVFPLAVVDTQTGEMEVETSDSLLTVDNMDRNPGGAFNMIDIELDKLEYSIKGKGLAIPFHYNDGRSLTYNFELGAARRLRTKVDNHFEVAASAIVHAAGNPTTAATAAWTAANGVPLTDIETAINAFHGRTGMEPNTLILNRRQRGALVTNPQIVGRFPGATRIAWQDVVDSLGALFNVSRVVVSSVSYNTAVKGLPKVLSPVFPNTHCALALCAGADDPIETSCIGRQLTWSNDGAVGLMVEQYYWQPTHSEIYRVRGQQTINRMYRTGNELVQRVATGIA